MPKLLLNNKCFNEFNLKKSSIFISINKWIKLKNIGYH